MESRKDPLSRKLPNVDRLSSLPDPILCHILSFLPTKFSAATSILSRKWRSLWADVPIIDLDFQYNCTRNEEQPQISDIINRILFLGHKLKDLNTLRLKHHDFSGNDELTQHQLETWIAAVIARCKVQNIELHFNYCMKLPECLFTYRSLVDLRLRECAIRISLPASICFPCLEKLHLCSVIFHNDETFQQLISGCSHLEELMVINYDCSYIVCRRIYSPTLKWLTIDFRSDAQDHKVEIITPALQYLQVKDSKYRCISTQALSSLTEADITLKMYINDVVYSRSVLEFLDSMSNVKCLKLDINYDKFLQSEFSISSQRFHNLTKLELGADWCFMLKFLEIADNLQLLIINWINEDLKCWVEPQQVFSCLQSHLRSVVINYFCCKEHEYTMVQYLLKNAKVLTSMKIKCQVWDEKKKDVALKRISLFEQGSDACKVDVY